MAKRKTRKKTVKKSVEKQTKELGPNDIKYTWEIVSIVTSAQSTIEQIIYELHGTVGKYSTKKTAAATGALALSFDPKDEYTTTDYNQFKKNDLIKYVKSKLSDKYLNSLKNIITQELFGNKKMISGSDLK